MKTLLSVLCFGVILAGCNLLVAHEEDGSATCTSADTTLSVGQQTMNCHKVDSHWEWGPE